MPDPVYRIDREPVYKALDAMPESMFCALLCAMSGVVKLSGTILDDPTPCVELDKAIKPFIDKLG